MKKFLLSLLTIFCILATANAEEYTHTFKKGELTTTGGTVTLSGIEWNASTATYIDWNDAKGIQLGSKNTPNASYILSTSGFEGCTIRSITVNTGIAASGDAEMTITVGSQPSETYKPTTSAKDYTFDCEDTTGDITISWTATQRAYYVKSITIDYAPAAGSVTVAAPEFKTPNIIYADKVEKVTVETTDQDAVLYYTTDGTEPSYEDWVNETGSTMSSKYYVMYFNLTETTTIKVMAVKTDGDAVYKSEIVEATYIVSPTMPYLPVKEIVSGNKYAMVAADSAACALYGNDASGNLPTKTATAVNDRYTETVACAGFTFTATDGGYTIQDEFGRYINPGNTEGEFTFTTSQPAAWSIQTDNDGNATITSNGRTILYSASNATFGSYSTKSEENLLPKLYKQRPYPTYTITPENGSTMEILESIFVTCEEGISSNNLAVTCDEIETTFTIIQKDANTLEIKATEPITTYNNANISINITGDIILNPDGIRMSLPVQERYGVRTLVKYMLYGNAPAATITEVSPANGSTVDKLSHFVFTFSYYAGHSDDASLQPRLYAEGKTWTYALERTIENGEGGNINMDQAALKTTEPLLGNGTYILEIPTGYFTDGNGKNIEGMTLRYTVVNDSGLIASIDKITGDSNSWTVFNMAGVKLLETTDATKLGTLRKGMYIINGTKVLIK